jgi:O-antigen ligase
MLAASQTAVGSAGLRPVVVRKKRILDSSITDVSLAGILFLTGFLDAFQWIKLGSISLNGILTVIYCGVVVSLLLIKGRVPRQVIGAIRPGIFLAVWSIASVAWNHNRSGETLQNVSVLLTFIVSIMLMGALRGQGVNFPVLTLQRLPFTIYFASLLFLLGLVFYHTVGTFAFTNRGYALYVAVGGMWFAAGWRFHEKKSRQSTLLIIVMIAASLSRTALSSVIVLLPWIVSLRAKSVSGWLRPLGMLLLIGSVSVAAIYSVPALHDRFLSSGDRGVTVNGTSISTEGRAEIWATVYADALTSPIVGLGAGSATDLVIKKFGATIAQPHNDYLRIFHDYGLVGLALWLWFVFSVAASLRSSYLKAQFHGDLTQQRYIVAGISALCVVLFCMTTDNIFVYVGPMFMAAILLGNALGGTSTARFPASSWSNSAAMLRVSRSA